MNLSEIRTPDEAPLLTDHIKTLNETGSSYIETVHLKRDGTTFPIEISAYTVEVEGKRFYQSIGRDITDRKRTEEEMRESNKKLSTIINNLRGVVFRCKYDENWTMQYISDGIYELAGYLPNEFINNKIRTFKSIIDPLDSAMVWRKFTMPLRPGTCIQLNTGSSPPQATGNGSGSVDAAIMRTACWLPWRASFLTSPKGRE